MHVLDMHGWPIMVAMQDLISEVDDHMQVSCMAWLTFKSPPLTFMNDMQGHVTIQHWHTVHEYVQSCKMFYRSHMQPIMSEFPHSLHTIRRTACAIAVLLNDSTV